MTKFVLWFRKARNRHWRLCVGDDSCQTTENEVPHGPIHYGTLSLRTLLVLVVLVITGAAAYFGLHLGGSRGMDVFHNCNNNLHDIYRSLEKAKSISYNGTSRVATCDGWRIAALPFLDHAALYDSINTKMAWNSVENTTCAKTVVATYLCPSSTSTALANGFAKTNYLSLGRAKPGELQNNQSRHLPILIDIANSDVAWLSTEECSDYRSRHLSNGIGANFASGHSLVPGTYWALFADGSVNSLPQLELARLLNE